MTVETVEIRCPRGSVDSICDLLWQLGCRGVADLDPSADPCTLVAGFVEPDIEALTSSLRDLAGSSVTVSVQPAPVPTWRRHARPVTAGGIRVRLPEHDTADDGSLDLVIEPGDVFGSGSHPSTRLALEALAELDLRDRALADVGCGTGVLGIAAGLLGASVVGVDVDPAAVRSTTQNAAANRVTVAARLGSVDVLEPDSFDVVVANMTIDVQRAVALDITRALRTDGTLVLSGLLDHQLDEAVALYPGARRVRRIDEGEWACVVLESLSRSPG